jgi:hypothetical protein
MMCHCHHRPHLPRRKRRVRQGLRPGTALPAHFDSLDATRPAQPALPWISFGVARSLGGAGQRQGDWCDARSRDFESRSRVGFEVSVCIRERCQRLGCTSTKPCEGGQPDLSVETSTFHAPLPPLGIVSLRFPFLSLFAPRAPREMPVLLTDRGEAHFGRLHASCYKFSIRSRHGGIPIHHPANRSLQCPCSAPVPVPGRRTRIEEEAREWTAAPPFEISTPPVTKKRKASPGMKPGESEPTASSFSREQPLVGGGDSSSAEAAAVIDTTVATTKGMAASPPKASSDGDPPDSRRYWPLWTRCGAVTGAGEDILPVLSEAAQAKQQQRKECYRTIWTLADEVQWNDEKELFGYHLFMRGKIEACRGQIERYQQDMEDIRRKIRGCEIEMKEIGWEVDRATVVPGLRRFDRTFWNGCLPKHVQHDAGLAWLLVRSNMEELPAAFQRMLWTDPSCPLRSDRELLLASLENAFLRVSVKIVWSREMANDRELVMKCFDRCPRSVRAWAAAARSAADAENDSASDDDDDDEVGAEIRAAAAAVEGCELPDAYFEDMEMLRAYAFPADDGRRYCYRMSQYRYHPRRGFHTRFSPALLSGPRLLVDLLVLVCTRQEDQTAWARSVVCKAFPDGARPEHHPLLDSEEFALQLARATARIPDKQRHRLKVTYGYFSDRVRFRRSLWRLSGRTATASTPSPSSSAATRSYGPKSIRRRRITHRARSTARTSTRRRPRTYFRRNNWSCD